MCWKICILWVIDMPYSTQIINTVNNFATSINYIGTTVVRTPVTKTTSNSYGDETLTEGTAESINVYFTVYSDDWIYDKEGNIRGGNAYIMCKSTQTINLDDKITYQSIDYRVKNVIKRYVGGVCVFQDANLFRL